MDLAIEANRNSALFNTMQDVLDVYNPLLHKARPTIVNQTKHRIRVNPTRWSNTMDSWNGSQSVRFDLPRIGSLVDFSLKCAFRIPGDAPTDTQRKATGDRGFAKTSLTTSHLDNTVAVSAAATTNSARGRLDRVYADRLLGFNMIKQYTVSSKSRRIFTASGEYLLVRFSQMDEDMKKSVMDAITPVDIMDADVDSMFYAPGISYVMNIPLFMFFNEHITSALDVNFSEEVHIDIELKPPSQLFYYGQLGDLTQRNAFAQLLVGNPPFNVIQAYADATNGTTTDAGTATWDQAIHDTAAGTNDAVGTVETEMSDVQIALMQEITKRHIQGTGSLFDDWGASIGSVLGARTSGPTFAYPDVDNNGESVKIQFEANADYIVQDTDAYRALRQQMFPEGSGLTTITYDTSQEVFQNLMSGLNQTTLLDRTAGGSFTDPAQSSSGIQIGDSTRFVDLPIRTNTLAMASHFMVRKHSDMGGSGNTVASLTSSPWAVNGALANTPNVLGAHRIYTRCLPVHYFQILAAGRVIYESDGDSQLNLTQSGMYNGTGLEWGTKQKAISKQGKTTLDAQTVSGRPFNIYSIPWGLQASRLENSGCLSFQNLNNPTLRIYFKPDAWAEYSPAPNAHANAKSDALTAAELGVQVDLIHEHFNVITINSGNGEITSGLNQ